ncbi:MAG: acyl-CoA dehydratase activase [Eubacteriales bacterium]
MKLGIDIGSTTVKVVLFDNENNILFKDYKRHFSDVFNTTLLMLQDISEFVGDDEMLHAAFTGSAGLGVSKACDMPFVQEVFATQLAIKEHIPDADVVVELGGEDAKIIFLTKGVEYRMNGSCAGGTGAFIDQMATLLDVSLDELNELSLSHDKIYTIASRCGVFAKSDIQPLLNQGANKNNIAASIHQAVVDQTIAGLAQGREIEGKVVFLGGPLTFSKGLRDRFKESLKLTDEMAVLPENSQYFVGIGASMYSAGEKQIAYKELLSLVKNGNKQIIKTKKLEPLFKDEKEYAEFVKRHSENDVPRKDISSYEGDAYLGIDAGSTTTKIVLIDKDCNILFEYYGANLGNPVRIIKKQLSNLYEKMGSNIKIASSGVVGYGEDLIKTAFSIDHGLVETVAHYKAAHHFNNNVNFIMDIGGQDIKCFHIKNHAIDNIFLNEACSSGCGSFIQTYAKALGYEVDEFAKLALFAKTPIDLGSRCTVFMNSSIKQAQKEGASVGDISAGLSLSVVKNALYKVVRVHDSDDLGENIVVQGGTFLNDAVLRSFEKELGKNVTRPSIAGLMGAYGVALYAKEQKDVESGIVSKDALDNFTHKSTNTVCNLCTNHCNLTINTFNDGKKYIFGNRCERPYKGEIKANVPNVYKDKLNYILNLDIIESDKKIGIPLGLNMYENLPFWVAFFNELGVEVVHSGVSTRQIYTKGQHTIPSDTVCYPAKLMHGHIEVLLDMGIDDIFYPCMSYNFNEEIGDNHYNCPVVAYYPELLKANIKRLNQVNYINEYFGLHRKKDFKKKAYAFFKDMYKVSKKQVYAAVDKAYDARHDYQHFIRKQGEKAMAYAKEHDLKVIVLSGRPYHIDLEINHGIDDLITSFDMVLISEDCISHHLPRPNLNVLNQWTYQSRMYNAAKYVTHHKNMEFVQLVSFGCGTDAITSDEIRDLLERKGKLYTQIKIDEINNLGAARIRLRSLIAAID